MGESRAMSRVVMNIKSSAVKMPEPLMNHRGSDSETVEVGMKTLYESENLHMIIRIPWRLDP